MIATLAFLLAMPLVPQDSAQEVAKPAPRAHTFVFLDTAPNAPALTADERTTLQGEHLTRLQVMYEKRQAFTIGPFENGGNHRGMLLVDMGANEARANLAEDPLVKAGQLVVNVIPVSGNTSVFKQADQFFDLTIRQVVLFRDKAEIPPQRPETLAKVQADTVLFQVEFEKMFSVPYRAMTTEPGDLREIWIVDSAETDKVQAEFAQDPRVKAGMIDIQVLPFHSTKDTFLAQPPSR
ncbi:MAG: hypothetical protein KF812_07960 [Fimbriimonadaceae bacterium]|nr:hypothetical protein [Fimbriimonadaceae bacterium]